MSDVINHDDLLKAVQNNMFGAYVFCMFINKTYVKTF